MGDPASASPSGSDSETIPLEPTLAVESSDAVRVGTNLGRFVVLEVVGSGGMGRVLRAYDPKLQREVALKVVRTERLGLEARARMLREARAMAKVSHPNVVGVYDVEESKAFRRPNGRRRRSCSPRSPGT